MSGSPNPSVCVRRLVAVSAMRCAASRFVHVVRSCTVPTQWYAHIILHYSSRRDVSVSLPGHPAIPVSDAEPQPEVILPSISITIILQRPSWRACALCAHPRRCQVS